MRKVFPLLLLALPLTACGSGASDVVSTTVTPASAPRDVARAFFRAVQTEDEARFGELLTPQALAGMKSGQGFQLESESLEGFQLGGESVTGDQAEVQVTARIEGADQPIRLLMRNERERWLIYGMVVSISEAGEFTIDFEELAGLVESFESQLTGAFEEALEEAFSEYPSDEERAQEEREAFKSIVAVSTDEYEGAFLVDLDTRGKSALAVIEELVAPAGLAVDAEGHADALAVTLDLKQSGLSRVEAVERVAAEVGLYPVYPDLAWSGDGATPTLGFTTGERVHPHTFSGPFLVEVLAIDERVPHATGTLELGVHALGIHPAVHAFQRHVYELVRLDEVSAPSGDSLTKDKGASYLGSPSTQVGYISSRLSVDLRGLLRSVETIGRVAGKIALSVPVAVERQTWKKGQAEPPANLSHDLTVQSWGQTSVFQLRAKEWQIEQTKVLLSPRGPKGPLPIGFSDSSGFGSSLTAMVQTTEAEPSAIDFKIVTAEKHEYGFELAALKLERFRDMPVALEELSFEGRAPVKAEFRGFADRQGEFPQVNVRFQNTSNKDVQTMTVDFVYLDADGNELESFPHGFSGTYDFDLGAPAPLVQRGFATRETTTAFFMPAETERVRLEVSEVQFADGTAWRK